ncbi:MAG: hypothetical protein KDD69_03575 [Bdellovibrionales bacterium]|nr:hypothetical protein [Bdellovibrionales bacterium]
MRDREPSNKKRLAHAVVTCRPSCSRTPERQQGKRSTHPKTGT